MQADHPGHALYQKVRDGVAALDARHGREFDETSERMGASLLVLAKGSGPKGVDHVLLSQATPVSHAIKKLFVVQIEPETPAHLRTAMPTEQAAQAPLEQPLQLFEAVRFAGTFDGDALNEMSPMLAAEMPRLHYLVPSWYRFPISVGRRRNLSR